MDTGIVAIVVGVIGAGLFLIGALVWAGSRVSKGWTGRDTVIVIIMVVLVIPVAVVAPGVIVRWQVAHDATSTIAK
ncbi:MAG: hypothetical protein Q7S57_03140 [bacterium]|nr:hypothetical protein [bacterium]